MASRLSDITPGDGPKPPHNATATALFARRDDIEQIIHDKVSGAVATATDPLDVVVIEAAREAAEDILRRFDIRVPVFASGGVFPGICSITVPVSARRAYGPDGGEL